MLAGDYREGEKVVVDVVDDSLTFNRVAQPVEEPVAVAA